MMYLLNNSGRDQLIFSQKAKDSKKTETEKERRGR
jgi:hypothetical protein